MVWICSEKGKCRVINQILKINYEGNRLVGRCWNQCAVDMSY